MEAEMDDHERDVWNRQQKIGRTAAGAYERATQAAIDLGQRYSAEAFAASGSEDPMTQSYIAWLSYQRDLGEITCEYRTAMAACQREASSLYYDEVAASTTSMFGRYRDTIDQIVANMGARNDGSGTGASGQSSASESDASARGRKTASGPSSKKD